jgi:hypothetical protein
MRWAGNVAHKANRGGAYRVLVGRYEGRRHFLKSKHRWEDNIKINLQEVGWGGLDWVAVVQDRHSW